MSELFTFRYKSRKQKTAERKAWAKTVVGEVLTNWAKPKPKEEPYALVLEQYKKMIDVLVAERDVDRDRMHTYMERLDEEQNKNMELRRKIASLQKGLGQ